MNYSKMTNDELYKAAQEGVTERLIDEVSKRVRESQGFCGHRKTFVHEKGTRNCIDCGRMAHNYNIHNITRPENFWSLVELIVSNDNYSLQFFKRDEKFPPSIYLNKGSKTMMIFSADYGIAVGLIALKIGELIESVFPFRIAFAFLKIMEEK